MTTADPIPDHPDVAVEGAETVWEGRFPLQVVHFRNRRFDGAMSGSRRWELWRRGRAAALLPYDPVSDAVVLIEQFRLPALAARLEPVMVEIPAGLCDPGEDPAATLVREMKEETGLVPRRLMPIGDFLLTPGGSDECVSLYVGEVHAPAIGTFVCHGLEAEEEDIRTRIWPAREAVNAALSGRFANSVCALALFWLAARRTRLRRIWK